MGKIKQLIQHIAGLLVSQIAVTCIALGLVTAGLYMHSEGLLSSWKPLPSPVAFEQILDASTQYIVARATTGETYFWSSNCRVDAACNTWQARSDVPENAHREEEFDLQQSLHTCKAFESRFAFSPRLKTPLQECVFASYAGPESVTLAYYALTQQGEVYTWSHVSSLFSDVLLRLGALVTGIILGSAVYGLLLVRSKQSRT